MLCLITVLGWLALVYVIYRLYFIIFEILYPYFIGVPIDLKQKAGGKWAVVTGSTDGIGKAYAFELARKGFSVVLISRSQTKLDSVRQQLIQKTGAEVKTIAFDFTSANVDEYEQKILSELQQLDVGILVNNVGALFDYPEILHKNPGGLQKMADVEIINTLSVTLLSARILPQMIQRNNGIIVNISSGAFYDVHKTGNVYAATKAYVSYLTKIMQKEYANTNIIIQLLCPMVVKTNMAGDIIKFIPSIFTVDVDYFAKSAIRSIGLVDETCGCAIHQIQAAIIRYLPEAIWVGRVDKVVENFREYIINQKKKDH